MKINPVACNNWPLQNGILPARVAKLVDAEDLKSFVHYVTCRFESGPGHHFMRITRLIMNRLLAFVLLTLACSSSAIAAVRELPPVPYPYKDQTEFWVNSKPLSNQELLGKPMLVMFWTQGCHNCLASLAWINSVYERFRAQGLQVLGVHTPEFPYEKNIQLVRDRTAELEIKFPIMIDNDFIFWKDMQNRWWPSFYVVDHRGRVLEGYIGETHLDTEKATHIENQISRLLAIR